VSFGPFQQLGLDQIELSGGELGEAPGTSSDTQGVASGLSGERLRALDIAVSETKPVTR
jgi:hypothetical protein